MKKKKYIFILSHMRSYSSLLSHILCNNSEICGYTEKHIPYLSCIDFMILKFYARERYSNDVNKKYLLDKILNNSDTISEKMLIKTQLSKIFLLREPDETLKSIIRMSTTPDSKSSILSNEHGAAEYYRERLSILEDYSRISKGNNIFIRSESLINKTDETFELISDYLNLKDELKSSYDTFKFSGKSGWGDPSEYIKKGSIVRERNHSDIKISEEIITQCQKVYNECCKVLMENSIDYI